MRAPEGINVEANALSAVDPNVPQMRKVGFWTDLGEERVNLLYLLLQQA